MILDRKNLPVSSYIRNDDKEIRTMPTMILKKDDIRSLLDMKEIINVVEQVFMALEQGKTDMPPKSYLLVEQGDFRAMPAAVPGAVGVKWVNSHPGNPARGLPTVMAVLIYNDPATAYPLAVMEAGEITAYRTAATSAIAARYLARPESSVLGLIGAGYQAYTHILAHSELFNLKEIRVYDISRDAIGKLIKSLPGYPVKSASLEEAAAADIVCTLTPSRKPVVKKDWIKPGTHINAVGADAKGKQELDPYILRDAIVVVDDIRQASSGGEINVPIAQKLFSVENVYANLSELVAGKKPGRENADSITVFDSTGIAIEDIASAKFLYEKAKAQGGFLSVELV
jgi:alanine dehydrogenase